MSNISSFEQDLEIAGAITTAFAFPAVALSQLVITKKPNLAMLGAGLTWYCLYDGTTTRFIYAYLAAGAVFTLLDKAELEAGVVKGKDYVEGVVSDKEKALKQKLISEVCEKHKLVATMLKLECPKE